MLNIEDTQCCPYCDYEVEDHLREYEVDAEEVVKCNGCGKDYIVKPQYQLLGWVMEKQCEKCEEWSEDGEFYCDCDEEEL